MFEIAGNVHIHTPYSDGAKWHAEIAKDAIAAGLDFIVVTDHNIWVDGVEGYYEDDRGRVLLLVGEEVHNPRRVPQASHFLVFGADKELSLYGDDPQRLINETRDAGGWGFLAHPFDPAAPSLGEGTLGWLDWDVDGFSGLEIWNYMSNLKGLADGRLRALRLALNPQKYVVGPDRRTLDKWDELLSQGKHVAAIGGSDAHAFRLSMGPLTRTVFPYEFLFRTVNLHLLLPEELNGDLSHDKALIMAAIGTGNSWVAYDMAGSTKGFRFSGQSRSKGIMGDEVQLDTGATLQVVAPAKCRIRLLQNGKMVQECENDVSLTHLPSEPGAFRVECSTVYLGKERGWIYSNPIYLR
ncbi:MAG: PHP domain-containing protein [Chloroflexota bacterium]|nr:MAG: PHP domain-containing protein [Chloroflexota bacterium]